MIPKPNKDLIKSYILISLLPIISKLLEKLFHQKLMSVIEEKRLIPKHQFVAFVGNMQQLNRFGKLQNYFSF